MIPLVYKFSSYYALIKMRKESVMGIFRTVKRLLSTRDDLETRLLLHEASDCFGQDDWGDITGLELRSRIREVRGEIRLLHRICG